MGSLLTMACLPAILITPRARVTVTTIGRPSGMAATARLEGGREERGGRGQRELIALYNLGLISLKNFSQLFFGA